MPACRATRAHATRPRTPRTSIGRVAAWTLCGGLLLALGCTGDSGPSSIPGYVLTLEPTAPDGTDPFPAGADVSLVLAHDDDLQVSLIGSTNDGQLSLPELPLLEAGDIVGILVESSGGRANEWDPELTVAYGQRTLEEDLPTDGSSLTLDVLVAPADALAGLGFMEPRRLGPGVAMVPGGDVFVFGGMDPPKALGQLPASQRQIYRLTNLDDGETAFDRLSAVLQESEFSNGALDQRYMAMVAQYVEDEDGPMILVAGGRIDYLGINANTDAAWLFDPNTRDWVQDGGAPLTLTMSRPRSEARKLLLENGDVVLYGGVADQAVVPGSVDIYDTSRRRFNEVDLLGDGGPDYGAAMASLGASGALSCGGANLPAGDSSLFPWPAVDTCLRISLDGAVTDAAPLPDLRAEMTMVELADGKVLASGGMARELEGNPEEEPAPAAAEAWLYDPVSDEWTAVGPMQSGRAGHALVALPNGDALVIGGVNGVGTPTGRTGAREPCWERYNAATQSFEIGECDSVADGAFPFVAEAGGEGTFVMSGYEGGLTEMLVSGTFGVVATGLP